MIAATVEQMTDASDLIVRGVITEIWTEADDRGVIWTRAQLEVVEQMKGEPVGALIIDQLGGVHHNDYMLMPGAARFSPGEEALFFLERLGSNHTGTVGMLQGKFTVRIDPDNGEEMLVRFNPPQDMVYDHRFIPNPPAEDRVYYEDMEERVRARVELGWDGQPIPGVSDEKLRRINKLQPGVQ